MHGDEKKVFVRLFRFSKWIIFTNIIGAIHLQQGFFFLGYLKDSKALGIYSSAWNLVFGLDLMIFAVLTVLLPKASKLTSPKQFVSFVKQSLKISGLLVVCTLPIFFIAEPIITTAFTKDFSEAAPIFKILLIGTLLSMPAHPISLLLLTMERPQFFAYISAFVFIITFIANALIVPVYSATGAAVVASVSKILQGVIILMVCFWLTRKDIRGECVYEG